MAIIEDNDIELFAPGQQIQFAHTANNVVGVLAVACSASDTTLSLSPGGGALFPNAPFYCSIEFEVVWCLSKSGDSLIVQRGQDGTAAASHVVGVSVEMRNNAGLWTDAYNAINAVSTDVGTLQTNITNKTALPPDTTFAGNTQELTHKTIDLTDISKGNVIIGTVQPDPASLPLQNIIPNGGFEEWYGAPSVTLAAGTPASGGRNAIFANGWVVSGFNDSAITVTRDTANPDPLSPSGVNLLVNISTVQAADWVYIQNGLDAGNQPQWVAQVDISDIRKLIGAAVSASARIKLISGSNVTCRFSLQWYDGSFHALNSATVAVSSTSYATFKFENQIIAPNVNTSSIYILLQFQGVGQVAVDNVMLNTGTTAVGYRTKPAVRPVIAGNLLVNGGFEFWQRGNGPFVGSFSSDRWLTSILGTATVSITKDPSNVDIGSGAALSAVVAGTSGAFANSIVIYQSVTDNIQQLRGRVLSFSIRIRATPNSQVSPYWYDGISGGGTNIIGPAVTVGGGYQTFTFQIQPAPTATVLNVGVCLLTNATYILDNAMLVIGAIPAEYVPMHPADDLARCLRYYEAIPGDGSGYTVMSIAASAGQPADAIIYYKVRKALAPTATKVGASWGVINSSQPALAGSPGNDMSMGEIISVAAGPFYARSSPGFYWTMEANP